MSVCCTLFKIRTVIAFTESRRSVKVLCCEAVHPVNYPSYLWGWSAQVRPPVIGSEGKVGCFDVVTLDVSRLDSGLVRFDAVSPGRLSTVQNIKITIRYFHVICGQSLRGAKEVAESSIKKNDPKSM